MNSGIIFGWDGVIVDSTSAHERSWSVFADKHNLPLPQNFLLKSFGKRNDFIITEIFGIADSPEETEKLSDEKESIFRRIVNEDGIEPLPGIRALLGTLRQEHIPSAVLTSATRKNIDLALEILDLQHAFSAVITCECVNESKPATEIFLRAADALECAPEQCVVVENTLAGIEAARAGGFKTLAVATTNPAKLLERAGANFVAEKMTDLSLSTLRAILR